MRLKRVLLAVVLTILLTPVVGKSGSGVWLDSAPGQHQLTRLVSEPSTLLLLGTALLIAAGRLRRPKSKHRKNAETVALSRRLTESIVTENRGCRV